MTRYMRYLMIDLYRGVLASSSSFVLLQIFELTTNDLSTELQVLISNRLRIFLIYTFCYGRIPLVSEWISNLRICLAFLKS